MSDQKPKQDPNASSGERDDSEDVEGHNMWIGPTVSRDLARNRSKELERQARDRQRSKDSSVR
jgi:hypothetical protein